MMYPVEVSKPELSAWKQEEHVINVTEMGIQPSRNLGCSL